MNINNLQFRLQEALAAVTNTTDYLLLAKTIQTLNVGQVRSVATFSSLPSSSANKGMLYWVQADEILYWSGGIAWYPIAATIQNTAWAWGCAGGGRLGDGTTVPKSSPVSVVGGFTDWRQVSAGCEHSLGIRSNGTAWAWGCNSSGQLGDGTTVAKSSPVSVVGGFADWCQVSASQYHNIGVRTNGTAWAWGSNFQGRLGDGTAADKSSPVSVVGGFTDWCQVSAGREHSLAVRTNGTLWSWGLNTNGQLGDGTGVAKSSPVSVVGGFTDWCQVSAGREHSLAVRTNGTAWAWGLNTYGRLGDNSVLLKTSPVSVVGGFTDWCQVSAGWFHSFGLRSNGTAWAWGLNSQGRLGDGTTVNKSSPVQVCGGFINWCQLSAGQSHSLGIRATQI